MKRGSLIIMSYFKMTLLAIFQLFLAVLLQNVILSIIYVAYGSFNNHMSDEVSYIMGMMAVVVTGFIYAFRYRAITRGSTYEGGRKKNKEIIMGSNIVIFISLAIGSQFLISGVMNLIKPLFESLFTDYTQIMDQLLGANLSIVLIYGIIVAPITEELIFRGVILYYCWNNGSFFAANVCQAVLFGLYHGNIVQGIYAGLLGLLLGYVRNKYKTITAPILLHIMINASGFLLIIFPSNILVYVIMCLLGGSLLVSGIMKIKTIKYWL